MNRIWKRLTAMLIAFILVLGSLNAMAAQQVEQGRDTFSRGGSIDIIQPEDEAAAVRSGRIKSRISLDVDEQSLARLLEIEQAQNPTEVLIFMTAIDILRKLSVDHIKEDSSSYWSIGSERGEVCYIYTGVDPQTGRGYLLSSLLPGAELQMSAELADPVFILSEIPGLIEAFLPHLEAGLLYLNEHVQPDGGTQTGKFSFARTGFYDSKTSYTLSFHSFFGAVEAMLDGLRADTALLQKIDAAFSKPPIDTALVSKKMIAGMEELIHMRTLPEGPMVRFNLYEDGWSGRRYGQAEMIPNSENPSSFVPVSFTSTPHEGGEDFLLSVGSDIIDLVRARNVVINDLLLALSVRQRADGLRGQEKVELSLDGYMDGYNTKIDYSAEKSTKGIFELAEEVTVAYGWIGEDPLTVTLRRRGWETDEEIPTPARETLTTVEITSQIIDNLMYGYGEYDAAIDPLIHALQEALPQLLDRLKIAMPEEGAVVNAILRMMNIQLEPGQ